MISINTLAMTMNTKNDLQNKFEFRILFLVSTTCLRFVILLLLLHYIKTFIKNNSCATKLQCNSQQPFVLH